MTGSMSRNKGARAERAVVGRLARLDGGDDVHRSGGALGADVVTRLVIGLDLSITAPGFCGTDGKAWSLKLPAKHGDERLLTIAEAVAELARDSLPDLVVIEDLPTHAHGAGITGMVHGAARTELVRLGARYALVPPATLKKFATGKGNADKTAMAMAAYKRDEIEFSDDNECDAWWLWVAGMTHLGEPPFPLPSDQTAALDKVRWP